MTERFTAKKLVLSALFAALACVATMSIRIPTPGTGGYLSLIHIYHDLRQCLYPDAVAGPHPYPGPDIGMGRVPVCQGIKDYC